MVQGDKGVSRLEMPLVGLLLTRFVSLPSCFHISPASNFHLLVGVLRYIGAWNLELCNAQERSLHFYL